MNRWHGTSIAMLVFAAAASAHHIWLVPQAGGAKVQAFFSDHLKPDDNDRHLLKVGHTRLWMRDADGNDVAIDWTRGTNAYVIDSPGRGVRIIGGICEYGVETFDHRLQKHVEPYLLVYHPKVVVGDGPMPNPWSRLILEIVPTISGDTVRLQVLYRGKPAPHAEIIVLAAEKERQNHVADELGAITLRLKEAGVYGFRTRHIEKKSGELQERKYVEIRHYASLVLPLGKSSGIK